MREIQFHDYTALPPTDRDALRARVAEHRTLAAVLRWASAQRPAVTLTEVITQDEYTHDVVLALDPSRPLYLAYDTT